MQFCNGKYLIASNVFQQIYVHVGLLTYVRKIGLCIFNDYFSRISGLKFAKDNCYFCSVTGACKAMQAEVKVSSSSANSR